MWTDLDWSCDVCAHTLNVVESQICSLVRYIVLDKEKLCNENYENQIYDDMMVTTVKKLLEEVEYGGPLSLW